MIRAVGPRSGREVLVSESGWTDYWQGLRHQQMYSVEAQDYVARLRDAVALTPDTRVLDFGCGFGHVADLVAPLVGEVGVWDMAEQQREATLARTAARGNVKLVDLGGGPSSPAPSDSFDLILANSVIQYMQLDELTGWLGRWRQMLRPGGVIVLSDIPAPGGSTAREMVQGMAFAARHRFLIRALRDGAREIARYARWRHALQVLQLPPAELSRIGATQRLAARQLDSGLSHRGARYAVEFRPGP